MSLVNTTIKPFEATAYLGGSFIPVSSDDIAGKWAIFFFYPADFTFVCPTELGDLADHYDELQAMGVESTPSRPTPTSPTRPGTTPPRRSPRSATPWSVTPPRR